MDNTALLQAMIFSLENVESISVLGTRGDRGRENNNREKGMRCAKHRYEEVGKKILGVPKTEQ